MDYAETAQGRPVPILDYRRQEFRHEPPTTIQNLGSLAVLRALKWAPASSRRWLSERSEVLRNLLTREANVTVSGPATYLAKLGPKAPHATKWDRLAAGSVQSIETARRGFATAQLESEALATIVDKERVTVLNIGGGPANDNLNALLLLQENHPVAFEKLRATGVSLKVLDADPDGVVLGRNCLAVLQRDSLRGIDVTLERVAYDWNQPQTLDLSGNQLLVTAEGSLFEYADDKAVEAHLRRFAEAKVEAVIGTAFKAWDEISLVAKRLNGLSPHLGWRFRGLSAIERTARETGWKVAELDSKNSIYVTFVLRR